MNDYLMGFALFLAFILVVDGCYNLLAGLGVVDIIGFYPSGSNSKKFFVVRRTKMPEQFDSFSSVRSFALIVHGSDHDENQFNFQYFAGRSTRPAQPDVKDQTCFPSSFFNPIGGGGLASGSYSGLSVFPGDAIFKRSVMTDMVMTSVDPDNRLEAHAA